MKNTTSQVRPPWNLVRGTAAALLATTSVDSFVPVHAGGVPCRYTLEIIVPPDCGSVGAATLYPQDLNDSGIACGWWRCPFGWEHAFVWSSSTALQQPTLPPGTYNSRAWAITEKGRITGDYSSIIDGEERRGVFFSQGKAVSAMENSPYAVDANDAGSFTGTWNPVSEVAAPFRWSQSGGFEDLRPLLKYDGIHAEGVRISTDGTVCGWYFQTAQSFFKSGFLIGPDNSVEVVPPVAGGLSSELVAINAANTAAGFSRIDMVAGGPTLGFIYKKGQSIAPPMASGQYPGDPDVYRCSRVFDIADDGTYIGDWRSTTNPMQGIGGGIARHGHVYSFYKLLGSAIGTQIVSPAMVRINNVGQIIGSASLPGGVGVGVVFVATPVPLTPGDTDCDQTVNVTDLLNVIGHWQDEGGRPGVNDDGIVNHVDLLDVIRNWSSHAPLRKEVQL